LNNNCENKVYDMELLKSEIVLGDVYNALFIYNSLFENIYGGKNNYIYTNLLIELFTYLLLKYLLQYIYLGKRQRNFFYFYSHII